MRAANLKDWGQPAPLLPEYLDDDLDISAELGNFGEPVEDHGGLLTVCCDFIIKLSILVVLLACTGIVIYCCYKIAYSLKPVVQQAVCGSSVSTSNPIPK